MDGQIKRDEAEPVLARLDVSQPRRIVGACVQIGLGLVLISLAASLPREQMALRLALLALSGAGIYGAFLMWRATSGGLVLTASGLREDGGRLLAEMANMREVSRGPFALKPSHGFSLVLHESMRFAWVPGLWWRFGRRVGVGGVTPSQPARYMAEMITANITAKNPGQVG